MAKSIFEQIVDKSVVSITKEDLKGATAVGETALYQCNVLESIELPDTIVGIYQNAFNGCSALTSITIPNKVSQIGNASFGSCSALTEIRFEQPLGREIILPTAGSVYGMFYNKSAIATNVYTDNETIKNYDWASDNRTVTFYHLDGTIWE